LFANCSRLVDISIGFNRLTTLPAGLFNNNGLVERLSLSGNKLTSLPDDAFAGLASLSHLYLSYNELAVVNVALLSRLGRLEVLDLKYNRLKSMSPLSLAATAAHLSTWVDFSYNSFAVPDGASTLPTATPVSACVNLSTLTLKEDHVSVLNSEWSVPLTRLTELGQRFKNLTRLGYGGHHSAYTSSRLTVDLRDNLISEMELYDPGVMALLEGRG
jgi:Leucine-rich repeat (LRR) protein